MRHEYFLGRIDLHGRGRRGNRVYAIFDDSSDHRKKSERYACISYLITGGNGRRWMRFGGWAQGGQCQDTLSKFPEIAENPIFKEGVRLREKYGLSYIRLWDKKDRKSFLDLCAGKGEEAA